jgi:hypothetical protein
VRCVAGVPSVVLGSFVVLSMFSASTILFFLAFEIGRIWEKYIQNLSKMLAKSIKNEAWGTPWRGRGDQGGGRREGNQGKF